MHMNAILLFSHSFTMYSFFYISLSYVPQSVSFNSKNVQPSFPSFSESGSLVGAIQQVVMVKAMCIHYQKRLLLMKT